jgi:hypothetical protein
MEGTGKSQARLSLGTFLGQVDLSLPFRFLQAFVCPLVLFIQIQPTSPSVPLLLPCLVSLLVALPGQCQVITRHLLVV